MRHLSRRTFIIAAPLALAACVSNQPQVEQSWPVPADIKALYGPVMNEPYPLPAVDMSKINPKYWRQEVAFNGPYSPGTLVVDTQARFLYLVQENGRALRYGVGVG